MKSNKKFLLLCLLPLVVACNSKPDGSTNTNASKGEKILPDIVAFDPKGGSQSTGNPSYFSLQEFKNKFEIKSEIGGKINLRMVLEEYENAYECLEENLFERKIFASDVNEDGYRELIYTARTEDRVRVFRVFDVHNDKCIFEEENVGQLNKFYSYYTFRMDFRDNKVTFLPYWGNFSENSIADYGYLRYSKDNGFYFEWKNIHNIKSLELSKWYVKPSSTSYNLDDLVEHKPTKINNKDVYTFDLTTTYVMEVKLSYIDNTSENTMPFPQAVYFYREDTTKTYWKDFSIMSFYNPTSDVEEGIFRYQIQMIEEFEDRTWEFFVFTYSFNMSAKVVA